MGDSLAKPLTHAEKLAMFMSFATGRPYPFRTRNHGTIHVVIQAIEFESGFTPPDEPRHFNVKVTGLTLYVKTEE